MITIRPKPEECVTIQDIFEMAGSDIIDKTHIIVGPNGRCMCGQYGNHIMTCAGILSYHSGDCKTWLIQRGFGGESIKVEPTPNKWSETP